jgi:AAA family ATP:ADP antiporter
MFWAFTNSSVHLEGAKSYYGLILAGAQIGAIFGSTLATKAEWLSLPTCYALGGIMPSIMALLIFFYSRVYDRLVPPETPRKALENKSLRTDILEGLRTVFQHPYVMALAGISCLYEIVLTILDYEMKVGLVLVMAECMAPSLPKTKVYLAREDHTATKQSTGSFKHSPM